MDASEWDVISKEYYEHIQSPFSKGVRNPLYSLLNKIQGSKNKSVLEIGCGLGVLIPVLSKKFKHVTAIDISKEMIRQSKVVSASYNNITLKVMDAENILKLKQKYNVIVAVNSIITPSIPKVNKIIRSIHKILKPKGVFIGIFPSVEATIYQAMITFDKEYEEKNCREKARRATNAIISRRAHDFCYGFFDSQGKQKHFYKFELIYRLKKAGFQNIKIGKVKYPWKLIEEEPKPERFSEKLYDDLWDWIIWAEK